MDFRSWLSRGEWAESQGVHRAATGALSSVSPVRSTFASVQVSLEQPRGDANTSWANVQGRVTAGDSSCLRQAASPFKDKQPSWSTINSKSMNTRALAHSKNSTNNPTGLFAASWTNSELYTRQFGIRARSTLFNMAALHDTSRVLARRFAGSTWFMSTRTCCCGVRNQPRAGITPSPSSIERNATSRLTMHHDRHRQALVASFATRLKVRRRLQSSDCTTTFRELVLRHLWPDRSGVAYMFYLHCACCQEQYE
jgi:hypothetical protein